MPRRPFAIAGLVAWAALTSAHAAEPDFSKPITQIAARAPVALTGAPADLNVEMTNWKSAVPMDDVVGRLQYGMFCGDSTILPFNKKLNDFLFSQLAKAFKERGAQFGFAKPDESVSVFDAKGGNGADYRLGATLLAMDFRTCGREDVKGDAYIRVKWEAFSARRQQVVYSSVIEATYSSPKEVPFKDFYAGFMRATVDNLLADPKLIEMILSGGTAQTQPVKALATLRLDPGTPVDGGVSKAAARLLDAVVTVESGVGSGTGFYIGKDGYLLTNHHVVADAKFVRVKLANGRSLVGEVVRTDVARDVALLRTDPASTGTLALRREPARTGEDVYALGSPFGDVLSGTVTKGVLSSNRVFEGVPYLQSDVAVNPGNSGGPLIDANGRVLGMAQLKLSAQGINLFIPIEDVLDKLALSLQAVPVANAQK